MRMREERAAAPRVSSITRRVANSRIPFFDRIPESSPAAHKARRPSISGVFSSLFDSLSIYFNFAITTLIVRETLVRRRLRR